MARRLRSTWSSVAMISQVRIRVEIAEGRSDDVRRLEQALRDDVRLDSLAVERERVEIPPDELGAVEVLVFVATNVLLPLAIQVIYDYVKNRHRTSPGQSMRVRLVRVDHPNGRAVEVNVDGPPDAVIAMIRDADE